LRYDDLSRQLADVQNHWRSGRLDAAGAAGEVARLRAALPQVEPDRAGAAAYELDAFAEWLTPASQQRRAAARAVLDRVLALSAPPAQVVAAAEGAIEQIDLISESAPYVDERDAILQLCEPLELLIESIEVAA
jgi:hypothetical protein